jgi:hypothetical protein
VEVKENCPTGELSNKDDPENGVVGLFEIGMTTTRLAEAHKLAWISLIAHSAGRQTRTG